MVTRVLVSLVLALASAAVPGAATAEEVLPAVSAYDQTVTEPPPGAPGVPVDILVSLDRPADHEVTVFYRTRASYTREWPAGGLTFAPGQTERTVPFSVTYDSSGSDGFIVLDITGASGATVARSQAVVTIDNIDRAGSFTCGGMGARVEHYLTEGGYDDRIADTDKDHLGCTDRTVTGQSFTTTTPGGKGVKPVTITVTPTAVTLDRVEPPSPGFYGPFVGDGAAARTTAVDVTVSEPGGKYVTVEGLWGAVSSHCRALGAEPDLLSAGGATGVVVNGVRMRDLPDVVTLGAFTTLTFAQTERRYGTATNHYGWVTRTSLRVNSGLTTVRVGEVYAAYSGYPCQT